MGDTWARRPPSTSTAPTRWSHVISAHNSLILRFVAAAALLLGGAECQKGGGSAAESAAAVNVADNMRKFSELYGIATQIMNLGGNILNNAQGATGGPSASSASAYSRYARNNALDGAASSSSSYSSDGGNGVFGEVIRPQLRGAPSVDAYDGRGSSGLFRNSNVNYGSGSRAASSPYSSFSEYGGGPLGSGSRGQQRSIIDTLMGTFLGSSIGPSAASAPNFFSPNTEEYGASSSRYGNARHGSNIDAIVEALSRSGAKRAEPDADGGGFSPTSLLSQFFGGGKRR